MLMLQPREAKINVPSIIVTGRHEARGLGSQIWNYIMVCMGPPSSPSRCFGTPNCNSWCVGVRLWGYGSYDGSYFLISDQLGLSGILFSCFFI